jgi:hypothetical protein
MSSVYLEDYVPVVKYEGLNTAKDVSIGGTLSVTGAVTSAVGVTYTTGDVTLTTGNVVLSANSAGVSFTGTGTLGGLLTNLYNATASTLSGTQKDIKILIGTVPYYWTVYPTKA